MFSGHHHILHIWHLRSQLGKIYVHMLIQAFASSLVGVFIPLYLLSNGYSLSGVVFFFFIQWAVVGVLVPFAGEIIHRVGVKEVILIRTPIFVLSLVLLSAVQTSNYVAHNIWIIAVLLGIAAMLYNLSIQSLFAESLKQKSEGKETSKFMSLPNLGRIAGPFIGGLISVFFGFTTLFIVVAALLFASIMPIMFISKKTDHPPFHRKVFFQHFREHKQLFLSMFAYGIKTFVLYLILPLLLFYHNNNLIVLGSMMSAITVLSVAFTIFVGKSVDSHGSKKIIRIGALISTLFFLGLTLILHSPWFLYASIISGFVSVLIDVPFESRLFHLANKSPTTFLAFKETVLFIGRVPFFVFVIIFYQALSTGLYLGAFSSLLLLFV